MKSYQHLLNAMVGLCAALIGVRLILPAILEIPGFISLLTDETIPQPWEIFKFYLSSGMPLMELSLLAGGILCLLWFAKRRSGAFVQWAALLAAIGYLFLPFTILINGGGPLLALSSARHLIYPALLLLCGVVWKKYLKTGEGRAAQPTGLRFPFFHEFRLWSQAMDASIHREK